MRRYNITIKEIMNILDVDEVTVRTWLMMAGKYRIDLNKNDPTEVLKYADVVALSFLVSGQNNEAGQMLSDLAEGKR